ncbi:tRNA(Ile)-lysidine synthetase [Candidatus Syntrophocurvum alkaliphilum]|uniref:tRNA(Ile)-lysidine synthase n=1 Tax=Candidatus Syntrophocurvum alkaliphilum TaxID=2293317 RepID=A0A6I6DEI9_9FIRM|nr:tRNA lysidine(34) synthetase TilS [Candidatus Syntrophocurvum alkaliphilum]QGU00516.1 tRNA(Ile)-lysidine synthetase [Candidatus Syntrophocurvum alkaliphilum]
MALLDILHKLKDKLQITLAAAHLNHSLRAEADEEEQFVINQCAQRNIPTHTRTYKIDQIAKDQKLSLEEAGRIMRYKFFSQLKKELNANLIATAHHHDDVAETVLLHFLRGSGIKGLRGILPQNNHLIRPLLPLTKTQIIEYLKENKIPYNIDQTNYDTEHLRNRVRNELIPYLKEYNPRIVENLNQLSQIAKEENEAIEKQTQNLWSKILLKKEKNLIILDNQKIEEFHPAYKRRLAIFALTKLAGENGWDMNDVDSILGLSKKQGSSKTINLKKGVKVNKSYDKLVFTNENLIKDKFSYEVPIPGQVELLEKGETYTFDIIEANKYKNHSNIYMYLDYDKINRPLFIRSRDPGDTFRPHGLKGSKKLKDFFIDNKIPYYERDSVPILASYEEIYAVLGYRVSENAIVDADTKRILVIKREVMETIIK